MSTTAARQTHIEQVLIEATSFLLDRARVQLEREAGGSDGDTAASDLRRLLEVDKALHAIRRELGMPESGATPAPLPERQVSRFYEVPGQEDA